MNWDKIHNVYFIGIGGIGMSALARYFLSLSKNVSGYDKTSTDLTTLLTREGADIHFEDNIDLISEKYRNADNTLVIYTPAISDNHTQLRFFIKNGFSVLKRAEVLGLISKNNKCIAIAGTHGKTTTTSLTAHILKYSGINITAFLGGVSVNYNSNYISTPDTEFIVVEADEFDRSFLHLDPDYAVITSTDPDHLDIYGNENSVKESFNAFANKLKPGGTLIYKKGLDVNVKNASHSISYSASEPADCAADSIEIVDGRFEFDVLEFGKSIGRFSLSVPGLHNVENAIAAISIARKLNIEIDKIQNAIKDFKGVKRRFERILDLNGKVYIDDYAHHPKEIDACLKAARDLFPGKKITGVFQPHLYSRTRDFSKEFSLSLSNLDNLILMDIYPARELPIAGINSELISEMVTADNKYVVSKAELMNTVRKMLNQTDVLITMGAGDIDSFVQPIKSMMIEELS